MGEEGWERRARLVGEEGLERLASREGLGEKRGVVGCQRSYSRGHEEE